MEKVPGLEAKHTDILETLDSPEMDHELTERYKKEMLPLIEVLKPDDVSLEEYESEIMADLFEGVQKIQTSQGILVDNQENILEQQKALLHSRLVAAINDKGKTEAQSDFILKAKAALVLSANFDGVKDGKYDFRFDEQSIGQKVRPIFEKYVKEGNFELISSLLDNLDKSAKFFDRDTLYYSFTPQYGGGGGGWSEKTQREILTGNMSYKTFKYAKYGFEHDAVSQKLIPKAHYERNFVEELVKDTPGLRSLHLFLNYEINTPLEQTIHDFEGKINEVDGFQSIDNESIHEATKALKEKAKEHYRDYNSGSRTKNLFATFEKKDFEDLITSGISINEIDPSNLPKILNAETREYLVDLWIKEFKKNGKSDGSINEIYNFFTISDFQKLITGGVKVSATEISPYKLREFQGDSLMFFEAYTTMSHAEQEEFQKKIISSKFFDILKILRFEEVEVNELIHRLNKIAPEHVDDYLEVNYEVQGMLSDRFNDYSFVENKSQRQEVFDQLKKKLDFVEDKELMLIRRKRLENIQESFFVLDDREKLPPEIRKTLKRFENQYGKKGLHLIALAISAYGIEHPENFSKKMEAYEDVMNKYYAEHIPDGAHVSMGIEYEVTKSIAATYKEESVLGYKRDIELVSRSANIGKGSDGVHEIATKPTYNPYILLAEVKLLQDAGFLDLNFEKYKSAPRGYHLSLVGESGLSVDENSKFLYNTMTMTQLTGVLAGKLVGHTRQIHRKQFDVFDSHKQNGERVEIKGMGCDTIEQFEKAVLTSHHAGIAIQVRNKYFGTQPYDPERIARLPATSEEFEKGLLFDFKTDQERDIVFAWLSLQKGMVDAVEQHNTSFFDSEFNGSFFNKDNEYVDTSEHIDVVRNKKLLDGQPRGIEEDLRIDKRALFTDQYSGFVNALILTNNIFLKGPAGQANSSVNAQSMLEIVKRENYQGVEGGKPTQSIFENGGNIRDGYYVIQGASEEMISHKSQILLNNFNKAMEKLLKEKPVKRVTKKAV